MNPGQSCPPNARKRSTGALHRARNAGKRSTGAVLRAKIEFLKKYFVSAEGHSKLAFEKISIIFSVLFLDDVFFTKRAVVGGNLRYFWVRNSVPWPEIALLLVRMGFAVFRVLKLHFGESVRDFRPWNRIPHPKIT